MSEPRATAREVALALFVADVLLSDFDSADDALPWARRIFEGIDTDPLWKDGKHFGDCTQQAQTCNRCVVEEYEKKARGLAISEGFDDYHKVSPYSSSA